MKISQLLDKKAIIADLGASDKKGAIDELSVAVSTTTSASAKDIDTAMRLGYNFKTGPLEMADSMGLDEVLAWMETLPH